MDEKSVIEKGLQAAKEAAAEAGMTQEVEQLENQITKGGQAGQAGLANATGQKDGLRFDYDDASDV